MQPLGGGVPLAQWPEGLAQIQSVSTLNWEAMLTVSLGYIPFREQNMYHLELLLIEDHIKAITDSE